MRPLMTERGDGDGDAAAQVAKRPQKTKLCGGTMELLSNDGFCWEYTISGYFEVD